MNTYESLPTSLVEAENLIQGAKNFVKIFTECLMVYYKIEELNEYLSKIQKNDINLFKIDNFLSMITNIIFTPKIYGVIKETEKIFFVFEAEKQYNERLCILKDKDIEFFEIPPEFTLNQATLKKIKRSSEKEVIYNPYIKLINLMKQIEFMASPFFQLKLLCEVSEGIEKEIKAFYESYHKNFDEEVDTDIFLAIHIYIISKSSPKTLITILNLIEEFMSERQKLELPGYYLTIYNAGVQYIQALAI